MSEVLEKLRKEKAEIDDQIVSAVESGEGDLSRLMARKSSLKIDAVIAESRAVREKIAAAKQRRSDAKEELKNLDAVIGGYAEEARQAQDIANLKIRRLNLAEIRAYGLQGEVRDLFEELSRLRMRLGDVVGKVVGKRIQEK